MAGYDNELSRIVEELNRAATGSRTHERRAPQLVPVSASLDQLLSYAAKNNASDVLLVTGSAVAMRVNGALTPAAGRYLEPGAAAARAGAI
jgi:twitching motility protein PilT